MGGWDDKKEVSGGLAEGREGATPSLQSVRKGCGRQRNEKQLRTYGSRSRSRSDSGWNVKGVDENKTPKNKRRSEYGDTDRTRIQTKERSDGGHETKRSDGCTT